jgi:hypothetical protein
LGAVCRLHVLLAGKRIQLAPESFVGIRLQRIFAGEQRNQPESAGAAWVVPWAGVVDVVCWAKAGIASAPATSNAMRLFFILNFLRLGERFGLHSSTPESVLRDF